MYNSIHITIIAVFIWATVGAFLILYLIMNTIINITFYDAFIILQSPSKDSRYEVRHSIYHEYAARDIVTMVVGVSSHVS